MKHLPAGHQDFALIRNEDFLYVDKTRDIYQMVEKSGYRFLSRPRRFGKSLTCTTLKYLFEGRRGYCARKWTI